METTSKLTFYYAASALHRRKYDLAFVYFDDVLRDAMRLNDDDLQANAHFYLSTCARKRPSKEQDVGLNHLLKAKDCLQRLKPVPHKRIAVVEIHRAWEEFGQGNFDQASRVARFTVRNSGSDRATKAYAQLLLARIQRRKNNYLAAKELNREAIKNFGIREPRHRALARAYANLALTNILLAMTLRQEERADLLSSAASELDEADKIYAFRHHDRGTRPEVENLRALIEVCEGKSRPAIERADRVYKDAKTREDYVEMSTARIIQCMSFLQLASSVDCTNAESGDNFADAYQCAKDAVLAADSQGKGRHPRRQARARVWLGRTLLSPPVYSLKQAKEQLAEAEELLPAPKSASGYIGDELRELATQIRQIEESEKKGEMPPSQDTIYRITAAQVVSSRWTDTKREFEEKIVAFLFNNGMRFDGIRKRILIRKAQLTAIKARCVEKGMISKSRLDARRGRGHRDSA